MSDTADTTNKWTASGPKEGLVSTPSAQLYVTARGPARQPEQPMVIFESGAGLAGSYWAAVARLLSPNIRSLRYDRAGLGRSKPSPALRNAANLAAELCELLAAMEVRPPYVLAAHTYGGFIVRELLALLPADSIVGMVFIDATQEKTLATLEPNFELLGAVLSKLDYFDVVGIRRDHKYTPEEWARFEADSQEPAHAQTAAAEDALVLSSAERLASRKQFETHPLAPYPLTFIRGNFARDLRRIIAAAREEGVATPEQIAEIEGLLERVNRLEAGLHEEQLKLTVNGRIAQSTDSGHSPHMTDPQFVADEIRAIVEAN